MSQEEKNLLLQDLCARIPYGVKAILSEYHIDEFPYNGTYCDKVINLGICEGTINLLNHIEKYGVKPYLRPMSSMTEEERNNLRVYCRTQEGIIYDIGVSGAINSSAIIDWLNSHYFDYRNLIEKGLALVAPKGMY